MHWISRYALSTIAALLIAAAGCTPVRRDIMVPRDDAGLTATADPSNAEPIKALLYRQLEEWRNVPYRAGGLSKRGVDCSGFVYLTYLSKFGIEIPRTTRLQAAAGRYVGRNNLQAGDIVFFRTGIKSRHVGIYIENHKFIHASKSSGVMLSRLDNAYWSKKYWKAVRIRKASDGNG